MQVNVIAVTSEFDCFLSDKVLTALKKIRSLVDVISVNQLKRGSDFNIFFEKATGIYLLLCDEKNYAYSIKNVKENSNFKCKIICLDKNFDVNLEGVFKRVNCDDCYKLFDADCLSLENFAISKKVKYSLINNDGDVLFKMRLNDFSPEEADVIRKNFLTEFSDKIYATNDVLPERLLVELLKTRSMKISVAESFTGGNISAAITSVSGASGVFYEGQVVYNENAKAARLGVSKKSLNEYKPVSKQVAYEMCLGLLKTGKCDVAISTTGIAGPNSDDSNFPVGLCYIGVGTQEKITVYKFNFKGGRSDVVNQGVKSAICLAIKNLL